MPDSVGRTAMIAVIAGVLFAGFLALTPRLTAGTQEAAGPAVVATTVPAVSQNVVSDPVVAIPASSFDGWDRDVEAPEATVEPEEDWTDDRAEDDGSLELAVELRGPRDGKETVIISEGDGKPPRHCTPIDEGVERNPKADLGIGPRKEQISRRQSFRQGGMTEADDLRFLRVLLQDFRRKPLEYGPESRPLLRHLHVSEQPHDDQVRAFQGLCQVTLIPCPIACHVDHAA